MIANAKRDHRQFAPLYEMHFDKIYRFIFKKLGGHEEIAGDLAQLTFMKAMANIAKYEDRGVPFSAWLFRIALNEVNMHFRKQKNNYSVEINDRQLIGLLDEEGEQAFSAADMEQLVEIINNLEEEQVELIEMRFFQEMSFKEIADILEISEANAKMRVYRLLEKIKLKWKKEL
jgi:RNA polymerase sigma-70 factor (ECF subfamily)